MNRSSDELPRVSFQCGRCKEDHKHESDLLIHLIHDHEVQSNQEALRSFRYVCPYCQQAYQKTQYLESHMVRHHRERVRNKPEEDFVCGVCPKSFRTVHQLMIHRRFHDHVKPFKCKFCLEAFNSKSRLSEHQDSVHPVRTHQCDVCRKIFATADAVAAHRAEHFVWNPYLCPECGTKFRLYQQLRKHMDNSHGTKHQADRKKTG